MSMQDPIADFLTRVRNGLMARHSQVEVPASRLKGAIAEVLREEGYIESFEVFSEGNKKYLRLKLKYQGGEPVIEGLVRISKPSCRVYVGADKIPQVLGGMGVAILSTPKGVVADRQARKLRVGGEVICEVW